ncbi:hypothetical protein M4I21_14180 [Cellulophaga sp. 20_2_10]|uniref:FKBP-type peptidyl-prolyl cis-trans isomerase n=1 Tax=Cellulophaga sp. 20_2_10 TaxID=2942476 RepID=UPI00201ADCD2|nr:hypothetical protein [Cellulophaga sp. 20_2_10]MCL5246967.1 hypothetical protein [Cellulophaga sp. 20_2_10]
MKFKNVLIFVLLAILVWSCGSDDNGFTVVPPKALSEIVDQDKDSIVQYLETHFYNYEEFANPPADFDYKIVLGEIEGDNAGKTPLIDMMTAVKTTVRSSEIGLSNNKEVEHTYYYLVARQGVGDQATAMDSTYVRYEGLLLDNTVFDASTATPLWFDLATIQAPGQGARGFSEGAKFLKAGGAPIINEDGTFEITDYGVGLVIFPSALGYYNNATGLIAEYSPLIFKIDLMAVNEADHDNDGVPSYLEDLNDNGYLFDDNTDLASEEGSSSISTVPDYLDNDDDNDGKLTRDEISDADGNIIFPYPDSNNDGTPDYLDPNS